MNKPLSKCCHAPLEIVSADEGTNFHRCTKCGHAADAVGDGPIKPECEPISFKQAEAGGVVNMVPHGDPNPDKFPPGVIGGLDYPMEVRVMFPILVKAMFCVGALEIHHENMDTKNHAMVAEKLEGALMQLFMLQAKFHKGDPKATFDYWMEKVAPERPEAKP